MHRLQGSPLVFLYLQFSSAITSLNNSDRLYYWMYEETFVNTYISIETTEGVVLKQLSYSRNPHKDMVWTFNTSISKIPLLPYYCYYHRLLFVIQTYDCSFSICFFHSNVLLFLRILYIKYTISQRVRVIVEFCMNYLTWNGVFSLHLGNTRFNKPTFRKYFSF